MKLRTAAKFYIQKETYIPGEGAQKTWELVKEGAQEIFHVSWKETFGSHRINALGQGVWQSATLTIPYTPAIYEAMQKSEMIIAKNGAEVFEDGEPDFQNPNCYELWGGAENLAEKNVKIVTMVRRREMK